MIDGGVTENISLPKPNEAAGIDTFLVLLTGHSSIEAAGQEEIHGRRILKTAFDMLWESNQSNTLRAIAEEDLKERALCDLAEERLKPEKAEEQTKAEIRKFRETLFERCRQSPRRIVWLLDPSNPKLKSLEVKRSEIGQALYDGCVLTATNMHVYSFRNINKLTIVLDTPRELSDGSNTTVSYSRKGVLTVSMCFAEA
jgi:hypothetical protein